MILSFLSVSPRPRRTRVAAALACAASLAATFASAPAVATSLSDSGPLSVKGRDDVVIEDLHIRTSTSEGCAIDIDSARNVTIRRVFIEHSNKGICAQDVENLVIEQVRFDSLSTPSTGPHCDHGVSTCTFDKSRWADPDTRLAMRLLRTPNVRIDRVETRGASGGVFSYRSPGTKITDIVCLDIHGPYPRAQCVQFVESDDSSVDGFYAKNWMEQSRSEDNFNAYKSDRVTIQNGLIDGNFSVNGVGVIADHGSDDMTVRDVDILNTSVSAVSVWSNDPSKVGRNFLAERIRVKDTQCVSRDGQVPSSQGLVFAAHMDADNFRFLDTQYYNHCRELTFYCKPGASCRNSGSGQVDLREEDFTPRAPLTLEFPWEGAAPATVAPAITEITVERP